MTDLAFRPFVEQRFEPKLRFDTVVKSEVKIRDVTCTTPEATEADGEIEYTMGVMPVHNTCFE